MAEKKLSWISKAISLLTILASTGILLICALPRTLSALTGAASAKAFLAGHPWLVPLLHHKGWIFLTTGALILVNGILVLRPRGKLAHFLAGERANTTGGFNQTLFWGTVAVYFIGIFFAYLLVSVLKAVV